MTEQPVLYELRENIAVLTLNRPHRLNAINLEMLTQLVGRLDDVRQDPAVSCAILTGTGRAFCSGEDLKETAAGKTLETWEQEVAALQEVQRAVMRLGKPLIAAVRGYAVGGGCEFAMSCDIRIASEDARFGFPETAVGMTVTTAGTKLLSHLVGLGKAKELVFTGEFIDAEEAARMGSSTGSSPAIAWSMRRWRWLEGSPSGPRWLYGYRGRRLNRECTRLLSRPSTSRPGRSWNAYKRVVT